MPWSRFLVLVLIISVPLTVQSAFERVPAGARAQALCGASHLLADDLFCLEANPASLCAGRGISAGLSLTPGLFGIPDLRRMEAGLAGDLFRGRGGMLVRTFGFSAYREVTLLAAYAVSVGEQVSVGGGITWYHLRVEGYGHASCLGGHLGLLFRLADQVRYGLAIRNINQPTLGRTREPVPAEILTCLEFLPSESFLLAGSVTKDQDGPITGSLGMEWTIENLVSVRVGAYEGWNQYACGIGFALSRVVVDYALVGHSDLGSTHHLTFTFRLP
jgi:hypothetical protein